MIQVRPATVVDAGAIYALINAYAERDRMLFRSLADIYENLQAFLVADLHGEVCGCCALEIIWADLAEIKSLAVHANHHAKGIGQALVTGAIERAGRLGVPRVFALTLEQKFFVRQGFDIVDKDQLPMKVWSDCARCPKQQNCDEIAVLKLL